MKIETLAPYHLPHEEILLSIASSVIFKELELQDCPKLSLSEVIEQPQYGYTASASHEPVGAKFVRITDIQAGKIDWNSVPYCECEYPERYLLRENDILFARTGGTTGKSFIVKGDIPDSIFASYLIRIRPKEGTISDFLYWFFQTKQYWSQIVTEKEGSAQPNVNGKKLASLDIFVPERSIQEAIANYLSSYKNKVYGGLFELPALPAILKDAEKKVAKIESLMAKIEEARRLGDVVAKEIENLTGIKSKLFDGDLEKWDKKRLYEVISINMGQSPSGHSYNSLGDGVPLLNGPTEFGKVHPTEVKWTTSPSKLCKKGDILICVRGATTGRMNWADKEYCIGRGLAALTPNPNIYIPEYVYHFVETQTPKMLTLAAGSTFPNLPGAKFKKLLIPAPPLPEQRRIVTYLDSLQAKVDELKRLQAETEKELEELVPSILDKAFKGEL